MKILAFDSSTRTGSVCLLVNGVKEQICSNLQKSHSESMNQWTAELMQKYSVAMSELDYLACSIGPGSFTGIRISLNIAKTFSFCFRKPILTSDGLTLLASQISRKDLPILAMMNAYKNMVYWGLFQATDSIPIPLISPRVDFVIELSKFINQPCVVVGDGFLSYEAHFASELKRLFVLSPDVSTTPMAEHLIGLSPHLIKNNRTLDWISIQPLYIRASEAEENKRGIKYLPL